MNILKHKYPKDVDRIEDITSAHGYFLSLQTCYDIWEDYSDSFNSKWLSLPPTDEILWNIIKWRVEKLSK